MSGGFRSRSAARGSAPRTADGRKVSEAQPKQRQQRSASKPPRTETQTVAAALRAGVDGARAVAYDTLVRVDRDGAYANLALPAALRQARITGRDAAFATNITYGALRSQGVLDMIIDAASSRPVQQLDPQVRAALRLGCYQLLYTRVEAHAAVDTSVTLVGAMGQDKAKGFVNAVLRTISRKPREDWEEQLRPSSPIAAMAFDTAHPQWIAASFARALGDAEARAALEADSASPTVHLVARPGELSAEELAAMTGFELGRYSPYAVYMDSGDPGDLDVVRQGLAAVQDEGSQLIARALSLAPLEGPDGGRWLDLCAGPGGKAALMGALARIDGATVDAVEVAEHRARLVAKTTEDLPVQVHTADGRNPGLEPGYDRILVDAPCSGLGALRRRPEARWRKSESDISQLAQLQFELLESAARLVRPGGVIVYSTCSPDLRETREVVDRARTQLGLVESDAREVLPQMGDIGPDLSAQMWPHRHGTDAMFLAVLHRPAASGGLD